MDKVILHCDLNNFYASVEQHLHAELRGKPIAVAGNPENRHGVVLAKSNEAKKFGVATGDTVYEARAKCPDIIFVPPTFTEYVSFSRKAFQLYSEYTDRIERFGQDECWLDVTGSKIFGTGEQIADELRRRMREEVGLTISVGVSFTKVFAKLGSDMKKPDATTVITRDNYKTLVWSLPPSDMIMVGRSTTKKLRLLNVLTIGALAKCPITLLQDHFGKVGVMLHNYANGIETEEVAFSSYKHIPKSVSNGTTTPKDMLNIDEANSVIYILADLVAYRLRQYKLLAQKVGISYKNNELMSNSRQSRLPYPTDNAVDIAKICSALLEANHDFSKAPLRAVTVFASNLVNDDVGIQINLFSNPNEKLKKLDNSIDQLKAKYGYDVIKRGVYLGNTNTGALHTDDGFAPFAKSFED